MDLDDYAASWNWKCLLPRVGSEKLAFLVAVCHFSFVLAFEFGLILFCVHYDVVSPYSAAFEACCFAFLAFNFYCNFLKIILANNAEGLPTVFKSGWKYCGKCCVNIPSRTYHCSICNRCIIRRDHHCPFSGCCIGIRNHRFYLLAVIHASCLFCAAIFFHWQFIWTHLGGIHIRTLLCALFPHFAFLIGKLTFTQLVLAIVQLSTVFAAVICLYLLTIQLYNMQRVLVSMRPFCFAVGQTQCERLEGIGRSDHGLVENLKDVLGQRWYLTWICPSISSPISCDFNPDTPSLRTKYL